jgi:hypothetical protein
MICRTIVLPKGAKLLIGFKTPREPPVYDDHSIYFSPGDPPGLYEKIRAGWGDDVHIQKITVDELETLLSSPSVICHRDKQVFLSELHRLMNCKGDSR